MKLIRLDLHVHSTHSIDGQCSLKEIVKTAREKGLNGVALADHNTIDGHKEIRYFAKEKNFLIIPGVEVSSSCGHIVALGVNKPIPRGLSPAETVKLIHRQGGVAIAAHPFIIGRNPNLVYKAKFDAIEGLNARAILLANPLAQNFAKKNKISIVGGSDAHHCDEVGLAYTELECELELESILNEIRKGRTSVGGRALPLPSVLWRILQKLLRRK